MRTRKKSEWELKMLRFSAFENVSFRFLLFFLCVCLVFLVGLIPPFLPSTFYIYGVFCRIKKKFFFPLLFVRCKHLKLENTPRKQQYNNITYVMNGLYYLLWQVWLFILARWTKYTRRRKTIRWREKENETEKEDKKK